MRDDELVRFEAEGVELPSGGEAGWVENDGARIWFASFGAGEPLVLLHGGLGQGGNWGRVLPLLVERGFCVVVVDSRGHGRSTRDARPYSYALMATDVAAVMDRLGLARAALVGWSDGACIAMMLALAQPERVDGVLFFACNVDAGGTKEFVPGPVLDRCFRRHRMDYERLSETPGEFERFVADVGLMQSTQPELTAAEVAAVRVPFLVAQSREDEFIRNEHAEYLAETVPGAEMMWLEGVTHFAPLQRPEVFEAAVLRLMELVNRDQRPRHAKQ